MKRICALLLALMLALPAAGLAEEVSLQYRYLGEELYRLGDTGYIVEHWSNFIGDDFLVHNIDRNAEEYNTYIPLDGRVKKYVYFIENPRCADMSKDLTGDNPFYLKIKNLFETTATGTLALESYTDFTNWFYMADHHWNYKGSYQAYCDIINMMFGTDEPKIEPIETVEFEDIPFNGSFHEKLNYSHAKENFTVYRFPEFVPYEVTINGSPAKTYGNYERYFNGKYSRITVYNHYNENIP